MHKIHMLCVDDEPEVLDAVVRDLASLENLFPIETARSVQEARSALMRIAERKDRLGVVVCDHIMPGENGVEFLIELYRNPDTATTRKILLTGQAGLEATVKAVNFARLDYFIGKPWTHDELFNPVRDQLRAYVEQHENDPRVYAPLFSEHTLAGAMTPNVPDSP